MTYCNFDAVELLGRYIMPLTILSQLSRSKCRLEMGSEYATAIRGAIGYLSKVLCICARIVRATAISLSP